MLPITNHLRSPKTTLLLLLSLSPLTTSQQPTNPQPISTLSFGHTTPISPNNKDIPNFTTHGAPTLFSDRIQLTPPHPGNKRGSIWATKPLSSTFRLDLSFRASGDERGGGNLQLWLVKDKTSDIETASVYTVDRFDGLGLTLDQYGGQGGAVRGFLNDGTTGYRARTDVDSLAFGHCTYPYRNLGRFSRLRLSQSAEAGLEVFLDEQKCFGSEKVMLPAGYFLGVTAASAENPDTFEVQKFLVSEPGQQQQQQHQQQSQQQQQQQQQDQVGRQQRSPPPPSQPMQPPGQHGGSNPSSPQYTQSLSQFYSSLQSLNQKLDALSEEIRSADSRSSNRLQELQNGIPRGSDTQLNAMARRLENLEKMVGEVKRDVEGKDYAAHLTGLQSTLEETQRFLGSSLTENVAKIVQGSAPRLGFFVFVVVAVQVMLAGSYVVYKRRRANSPKKLL